MNKETFVYGIDLEKVYDKIEHHRVVDHQISNEEFIETAEKHGFVWSLKGFEYQYNCDDIKGSIIIRII